MRVPALLIVDDEPAVLRTTELILQTQGYSVSVAATAHDAFLLLKSHHFDLLLLDCIPDRGWVVDEAKRANPDIRVAVCTGDTEVSDLPSVEIVLHKPVPPPVLLKTIGKLLSVARAA